MDPKVSSKRVWADAIAFAIVWTGGMLYWRPLVYNFDGYMYQREGLAVLENLNAHHLLWIPVQSVFNHVALTLGVAALPFCQSAGIALGGFCLILFYMLFYRLSGQRAASMVFAVFFGMSPQFWFLSTQNLPYVPFFICVMLALWACHAYETTRGRLAMTSAFVALALAVHFQQAALLLFLPLFCFFAWGEFRGARRWNILGLNSLLGSLLVCLPYLYFAHLMEIDSLQEFRAWVTDYMSSQHGLQYHWLGIVQTFIGITRTVIQSAPLENFMSKHLSFSAIAMIYTFLGVSGLTGFYVRAKRWRLPGEHRPLLWLSLGMISAWSWFIMSWEPLMAHYWCLNLVLGSLCMAMLLGAPGRTLPPSVIGALLFMSLGNALANHHQDKLEQVRNPDFWAAKIHQNLGARDLMIFLARKRIRYVDYDLLAHSLDGDRDNPVKILLPDYVDVTPLVKLLDQTRRSGGKIWISSRILERENYNDLSGEHDIFAPYPMKNLLAINGPQSFKTINNLLRGYALYPSALMVGTDRFLEIH